MIAAARIEVAGVVQGVGFRPFVYRLARDRGLAGWVNNTAQGVTIVVEGDADAVGLFAEEVRSLAPAMAVVESVETRPTEVEAFTAFEIRESETRGDLTLVSPDIATCPECLAELRDPRDRRHGYPFTNCTNCGPRFTIVESLPYDRPATSMKAFPMCPECGTEYADPADRRFHAQPNACAVCGPRLFLNVPGDEPSGWEWFPELDEVPRLHRDAASESRRTTDILLDAAAILARGGILAVKGLGGFHLACDATNADAVATLRARKRRWGKPFAIMVPDLDTAGSLCHVNDDEAALLAGPKRPIVLLRSRQAGAGVCDEPIASAGRDRPSARPAREPRSERAPAPATTSGDPATDASGGDEAWSLAPSVAPGLAEIGVMLPYTPLHHLLLAAVDGRPLVMTSGNLSDEPISIDNADALTRLSDVADAFLLHDRPILQRYDDSVVRVVAARTELVRRSRGYAPFPLHLPFETETHILAVGPEQKNTFTLARGGYAFVSQHIGDMENAETFEAWESTLDLYEAMFRVAPELVAHDLHPEYLTTKAALAMGLPAIGVQHHHAHVASVAAEHGISEAVIGLAYDGTGYGSDGTIWGGEVLLADWIGFERVAHLRPVPMPGGAAAIRRPARMAFGLLSALDGGLFEHPGASILQRSLTDEERATLSAMVSRGLNSPPTSSMGRLFDAVAALTGVRSDAAYEGQAAIELEALADPAERGAYRFGLSDADPIVIDPEPVVRAILDDLAAGAGVPAISARFHRAVAEMSVSVAVCACALTGARHVVCAGGVFMNRIVLSGVIAGVEAAGLEVLVPRDLPMNDGAVSYGQAVVAWARRDAV